MNAQPKRLHTIDEVNGISQDLDDDADRVQKIKLKRYDPLAVPKVAKPCANKNKLSPSDDEFWTTPDVFVLNEEQQYFGKKVYNEFSRCEYLHIAKKTPKSMQRIKFTAYEGRRILPFVKKLLNQIERHRRMGLTEDDPLEYFEKNPQRAFGFDPKYVREFWDQPADVVTCNLKLRVQFNPRNGIFEFGLLNPVPPETCEKFNNWAGPCMWLDCELMTALLSFIEETSDLNSPQ